MSTTIPAAKLKKCIGVAVLTAPLLLACDTGGSARTPHSLAYPATRTLDAVNTYHGTRVVDPYRWFEQLDTPEVRDWATAQHALMSRTVQQDSLREWFLQRMQHHAKAWDAEDAQQDDTPDAVGDGFEYRLGTAPGDIADSSGT